MKSSQLVLCLGLSGFLASVGVATKAAAFTEEEGDGAEIEARACLEQNEETLGEAVPMVWKNGRDTPVDLVYYYKDVEGLWQLKDVRLAGRGSQSVEVLSRCVYWYAKRGKAIYTPKKEKSSISTVSLNFNGKAVKGIALDLIGKDGIDFAFTLK